MEKNNKIGRPKKNPKDKFIRVIFSINPTIAAAMETLLQSISVNRSEYLSHLILKDIVARKTRKETQNETEDK